jgi:ankyrin repeat protein
MRLIDAALTGDLRGARQTIANGCDVDGRGTNGYTPVMEAARLGHVDVLTFLLTSGANVNLINFDSRTALHLAVVREQLKAVSVLLAFDANAELGDSNGQTPLMLAAKQCNVDLSKSLIEASPNSVQAIDKEGDSALGIAAYHGQLEIVRLLLDCGVALSLSSGGAPTPLMLAAGKGHVEILKCLLGKGARVDEMTWNGLTALAFAAEEGQVESIRTLLAHGAGLNKHEVGSAALATAAQRGHEEVLKLLLENDANVNAQDADGDSALHETVYSRSTGCARALIRSDLRVPINLNLQNKSGWTPLMAAAQRDLVEIAQLLLQKKVSVKLKTKDERTALHIAAEEGRVDVINLLLQSGAKIDAVTKVKWTPLMLAASRGHRETVTFLVTNGASVAWKNKDGEKAVDVAKSNGRTDVLDLLQPENPDAASSAKKQRTH